MENTLQYTPKSAWESEILTSPEAEKERIGFVQRYVEFLSQCKTEREVVSYVEMRLRDAGYGTDPHMDSYMQTLRGKAVFAVRKGSRPLSEGISLIAAHCDSPRLDFKQRPLIEQADVVQGQTHYYGGIRKYQWLARPLALHGIVICADGEKKSVCIGEDASDPVFCVADLLPHLAQKQMDQTVREAFEGEKLKVILGHQYQQNRSDTDRDTDAAKEPEKEPVKQYLLRLLHQKYGIREEDLITAEIEVVPAGRARYVGFDSSMVGAYGQDDRICVFTALEALLAADPSGRTKAVIFWDKEEIGSDGATGASSRFLQYCMEDMVRAWDPDTPVSHVLLRTEALSADVTAAVDPDFQELHEKQNAARLGFGPCFCKFTGSRGKYGASEADAEYFAQLRTLLAGRSIPWQVAELGKVDSGGGGTVALFLASWGMQVIDFGPALLAMHSPFELASCMDIYTTWKAYSAFLDR